MYCERRVTESILVCMLQVYIRCIVKFFREENFDNKNLTTMPRLMEGTAAVLLMLKTFRFRNRQNAYCSDEMFKQYLMENFRTKFNKLKKEYCMGNGMYIF